LSNDRGAAHCSDACRVRGAGLVQTRGPVGPRAASAPDLQALHACYAANQVAIDVQRSIWRAGFGVELDKPAAGGTTIFGR